MTIIGERFSANFTSGAIKTGLNTAIGALSGYVYGKLADKPAGECAKAWAIFGLVFNGLNTALSIAIDNLQIRAIAQIGLILAVALISFMKLVEEDF